MRCLVVYYSVKGKTKKVAEYIAGSLKCDLEEIREPRTRSGFFGFFRSSSEANRKKLPPIHDPLKSPGDYDIVIFGTPVWAGTMSSPARTFLVKYGPQITKAAYFCITWSAAGRTFAEMEDVSGKLGVATLSLTGKQVKDINLFGGESMSNLNDFISSVKSQGPAEPVKRKASSPAKRKAKKRSAAAKKPKRAASKAKKGTKRTASKTRSTSVKARKSGKSGARKVGSKSKKASSKTKKAGPRKKSGR